MRLINAAFISIFLLTACAGSAPRGQSDLGAAEKPPQPAHEAERTTGAPNTEPGPTPRQAPAAPDVATKEPAETPSAAASGASLKAQHEAELRAFADAKAAKAAIADLAGSYSRKVKSGTSDGDRFEVTDDIKLEEEEGNLSFDVLLNFFDEQECAMSGTARALKNGKFLFKDDGRAKGGNRACRLLIYKEGRDLVLTDDPKDSCRSHCGKVKSGKGGSFANVRFPLASRKR